MMLLGDNAARRSGFDCPLYFLPREPQALHSCSPRSFPRFSHFVFPSRRRRHASLCVNRSRGSRYAEFRCSKFALELPFEGSSARARHFEINRREIKENFYFYSLYSSCQLASTTEFFLAPLRSPFPPSGQGDASRFVSEMIVDLHPTRYRLEVRWTEPDR